MSNFGEGSQGGEETAVPAVVTSSNTQWVRYRDCWEDRSASQDVKIKFGAVAATLSDHASVWMSGALQHTTEITLDQPERGFSRDRCIPFSFICVRDEHWQSFGERLITMTWKRGDYCMNGISRKRTRSRGWRY